MGAEQSVVENAMGQELRSDPVRLDPERRHRMSTSSFKMKDVNQEEGMFIFRTTCSSRHAEFFYESKLGTTPKVV
jgi:hypothetical protein